jgi:hypothetical protein
MAVLRTRLNFPVSSITKQAVNPLYGFKRGARLKPLKLPLPGKRSFLCMAVLILSALAGVLTPWVLATL